MCRWLLDVSSHDGLEHVLPRCAHLLDATSACPNLAWDRQGRHPRRHHHDLSGLSESPVLAGWLRTLTVGRGPEAIRESHYRGRARDAAARGNWTEEAAG